MVKKEKYNIIDDYFKKYSERKPEGIYFYRINSYNKKIENFLLQYLKYTKKNGIYLKNNIENPTQERINHFVTTVGIDFIMDELFIEKIMEKWMPQLQDKQKKIIVTTLFETLKELEAEGKNINILKNTYIKYMCWFYYRFQTLLDTLGRDEVPKILFEGNVSNHELKILNIMAKLGCDIILLQTLGDSEYLKLDKNSAISFIIPNDDLQAFPQEFSVDSLVQKELEIELLTPKGIMSTNTWLTDGFIFEDSLKNEEKRGSKENNYYNMFVKILGVEDKNIFINELFKWHLKLLNTKRSIVLIENNIQNPIGLEVQKINKKLDINTKELIKDLIKNINFGIKELDILLKKAFHDIILEEENEKIQKLSNRGVILLCWLNRYIPILFKNKNLKEYPTFIYYGECNSENEKFFMKLLAKIPVDVIILCPDKKLDYSIRDKVLFEQVYDNSLSLNKFPQKLESINFGTTAYTAERELDTLLYEDSGMFRQNQFQNAIPIVLQTTYEEIEILWNQEAKYRQNFEILTEKVMVPVICSKISGIPNGDKGNYWLILEKFLQPEGVFIQNFPFINKNNSKTLGKTLMSFIKNKKIQIEVIKKHPIYKYKFIRDEMQNYMFEKMQQVLDSGIIHGTFINGMEFTILNIVLNLDLEILRLIQKYDFTKKIPKLIIVDTDENMGSKEDAILIVFLKFLGFDIILFSPTGYQSIDEEFDSKIFIEHQIGEYIYDMEIPDYDPVKKKFTAKKIINGMKSFFNLS